jgi:hypothetical protein
MEADTQSDPPRDALTSRTRYDWRVIACATLIAIDLLYLVIGLASLPRFYRRVSTLTVEPYYQIGQIAISNDIVQIAAAARGMSLPAYAAYWTIFSVFCATVMAGVGGLVLWRARRHWFGWFTAHVLLFMTQYPLYTPMQVAQLLPVFWIEFGAIFWPLFVLYFFLFPNGRAVPRWGRWPVGIMFVLHFLLQFTALLATVQALPGPVIESLLVPFEFLIVGYLMFALACQIYRYVRISTLSERLQTKWFVYGFAAFMVITSPTFLLPELTAEINLLGLTILPVSIAISILRYRLWDIDIIVRRTLIYGTLTAILAFLYWGGIVVLQRLMTPLIGRESPLAIVASTLAIAALFQPLSRRIQNVIDRRFYRRKYDAQRTLQAFSQRMRDETNLDQLTGDVIGVVQETLQPEHVSLWLREAKHEP